MARIKPENLLPAAEQVKKDFRLYWGSVAKERLVAPEKQRSLIVSAHRYAACVSQLSRAANSLGDNQRIFLQELASDAIHIIHVLVGGDARGARFYLRSIIENFWRHHYFRDHPVEYGWLHTRSKYYVEMKNLRDHCNWLDCFSGKIRPLYEDLNRLYGELSSSVHSTSSKTLVLRATLEEIRLAQEQADAVQKDLHGVMRACIALMIFSEWKIYSGLHVNFQDLLRSVLTVKQLGWLDIDLNSIEGAA